MLRIRPHAANRNAPAARFFPSNQFDPDDFREPGVYRIRFVYSTKSDDIREWRGWEDDSPEVVSLFKRVPKIEVRSDEFVLTVVPGK